MLALHSNHVLLHDEQFPVPATVLTCQDDGRIVDVGTDIIVPQGVTNGIDGGCGFLVECYMAKELHRSSKNVKVNDYFSVVVLNKCFLSIRGNIFFCILHLDILIIILGNLTPRGLYQNPQFSIAERTQYIGNNAEISLLIPYLGH